MTLLQMKYFIKVAHTGSFSKAASELFVSQPTLSRALSALEDELHIKLLVRDKPISLTEAGAAFLVHALEIEKSVINLMNLMAQYAITESKQLNLRISYHHFDSTVSTLLLKGMRSMLEKFPQTTIRISDYSSVKDSLLSTKPESDLVFTLLCDANRFDAVNYIQICEDPVLAVVPVNHPLSSHSVLHMSDFVDHKTLLIGKNLFSLNNDLIYSQFLEAGCKIQDIKVISDVNPFIPTLLLEDRVCPIPASMADQQPLLNSPFLRLIPIDDCKAKLDVVAAWRKKDPNPAIPLFLAELGFHKPELFAQ